MTRPIEPKQRRNNAESQREKAVSIAMKRKEEYLGARVPKELKKKIISRANEMGIPVSILVRSVLENAFAEDAETVEIASKKRTPVNLDVNRVEDTVKQEQIKSRFSSVLAWESIELNRSVACAGCGVVLTEGSGATLGLGGQDGHVVLCGKCKALM